MAKTKGDLWRNRKAETGLSRHAMLALVGIVLLSVSLPPFFEFPLLDFWLLPLGILYLLLLGMFSRLWLYVLPLATVALDLTPYTGRFLFNEFDLLFLLTLCAGLMYNRFRLEVYGPSPASITIALLLLVVLATWPAWSSFLSPPRELQGNPYYLPEYGYKVGKGLLWGLALVPMWGHLMAENKQRSVDALVAGACLAALTLGLIVLWERGTLGVLSQGAAWYHTVSSLLDLSSSYRVTGLFADMHTGGETIDGVILLLLPATLWGILFGGTRLRLFAALAAAALAYVTLVGFTRTTYVAFTAEVAVYLALAAYYLHRNGQPLPYALPRILAALLIAVAAAALAYRYAGSYGLAVFGALAFLGAAAGLYAGSTQRLATAAAAMLPLIGFALYAHFSSRWAQPSPAGAVLLVFSLGLFTAATWFLFRWRPAPPFATGLVALGALVLGPAMLAFALGGYQIGDRLSRAGSDLELRRDHWQSVVASAPEGVLAQLLGNGSGAFPAHYITAHPDKVAEVGSLAVRSLRPTRVLQLGGGADLAIGQRVRILPDTDYAVTIRYRSRTKGRLVVFLCERNLIFASNFFATCASKRLELTTGEGLFREKTVQLNSGRVGEGSILTRWPTLIYIKHPTAGNVVEIDSVKLSRDDFNLLHNSTFTRGMDRWFSYNDFSHLPWHVKNLYLQLWFEHGWLGLGLFIALLGLLLRSSLEQRSPDSLSPAYLAAVAGLCLFGLFGSPLDSPRVSWLFYFFLFAGLAQLRATPPRDRRSRTSSGRRS